MLVDVCVHNGGQESGGMYNRDSCSLSVFSHSTVQILCHNSVYLNSSVLLASSCTKMVHVASSPSSTLSGVF